MQRDIPEWVKPAAWGAAGGALALGVLLFGTGWAVTAGEASDMVRKGQEKAVLSALTPVCVAQFKEVTEPDRRQALLASLEDIDPWDREDFVSKRGWATMPGKSEPNDEVAEACADELLKLGEA